MNGTASVLVDQQDEEKPVIPAYGLAILTIGLFIITAVVIFLLLRAYRRASEKRAQHEVKDTHILDLMRERQRLLSQPSEP